MQEQVNYLCLNHIISGVNLDINCWNLHLKGQKIQVGNGQYISVLFSIPIVIDIHGHRFEIFTLVSEIY